VNVNVHAYVNIYNVCTLFKYDDKVCVGFNCVYMDVCVSVYMSSIYFN